MLIDMNNDGLPDYVERDGDNIVVRYNQCYKAGKLKRVTSFYGNKIEISYAHAPHSDYARQRPTVMSELKVSDALPGAPSETRHYKFEYRNYHHHTGERTAYGFDSVLVIQYDGNHVYRKTLQVYHNDKYKLRGLKRYEALTDPSGNIQTDNQWFYRMKQISDGTVVPDSVAHCFGAR